MRVFLLHSGYYFCSKSTAILKALAMLYNVAAHNTCDCSSDMPLAGRIL